MKRVRQGAVLRVRGAARGRHADVRSGACGTRCVRRWCLALATTIALVACGASSPKDQVRHAWAELRHAVVAGDARRLCALLSDEARALLIAEASTLAPVSTCEAAATTTLDVARDARAKAAGATLTSVTVHGDEATTTDSTGQSPDNWINVNGAWRLQSAQGR